LSKSGLRNHQLSPPSLKELAMPRFYINFRSRDLSTGKLLIANDDVGIEVPGLAEARAAGLASARETVADNVKSDSSHPMESIFITDESGRELMSIPAAEVLPQTAK
jgi:hypothetical protein